ncbi:MAG: HAD-IIA family hydrolase [Pirellulales bacterium]|nr:HAD-IIA family hydrolase [Pirellulales bacterium]
MASEDNSAGRLAEVRHVALDLDGTVYKDGEPFACTGPFLDLLDELGIGRTFLTNNCSRSTEDYVAHLRKVGIRADRNNVYTSADAMVSFLQKELPRVRRLFVVGTDSLRSHFQSFGFAISADDPADEPDAVVVGFDTTLVYAGLCRAAYWLAQGKPYLATHPDRVCPTRKATVLVDCGSVCAALNEATGRRPMAVPGKPDPRMLEGIVRRHAIEPAQLAMVGDRLYTDMAMARRFGCLGVLVLTGEATADEAAALDEPPDLVCRDLAEFGAALRRHRRMDRGQSPAQTPHAATGSRATRD